MSIHTNHAVPWVLVAARELQLKGTMQSFTEVPDRLHSLKNRP